MRHRTVRAAAVLLFVLSAVPALARVRATGGSVPGEVLVKLDSRATSEDLGTIEQIADADRKERVARFASGALWRIHSRSKNAEALVTALQKNPRVLYAEPNYRVRRDAAPTDPSYPSLWGLRNIGQTILGTAGIAGADIGAEAAWNVTTGSASVVIGVVDTGVDYTHPDLAANIWSNPGGKGNAACAAGTHGFNAINGTCDPKDDEAHGTHVSGTIGAVANNAVGIAGVSWNASIMGLKFIGADGWGTIADAIAAIDFAIQAKIDGVNVRVLSNSWGTEVFSKALLDAINKANEHDILFVASAGNDALNTDTFAHYPSSYATPNMISVAATDNRDRLASFSNYGPNSVHLGAPGVDILSTIRNGGYAYYDGTSMATPHVTGVAALLLAKTPSLTTAQVKSAILASVDPISTLTGKTVTGGRLNAARALGAPLGPDYAVLVEPTSRTVLRGATTTYTVTIAQKDGFNSPVTLSLTGLPAEMTATFDPPSTTSTSTLSITTTSAATVGTSQLTVTGTSGQLTHAAAIGITVSSATAPPVVCPAFLAPSYTYTTAPIAVAIDDFNRDGRPDVAAARVTANRVAIFLGSGLGSLPTVTQYTTGSMPIALATGDFDRDGSPDLAVANSGSHDVSIFFGNGDGSFGAPVSYPTGTSPFSVVAADFNGDGKLDLATANNGASSASVLLGNGDGTFAAPSHWSTGTSPYSIAAADLDRDGDADLAVAEHHTGKVSVLENDGNATFAAAVAYTAGANASAVAIAELTGDAHLDLAVTARGSNQLAIFTGNGDGTFQPAVHLATEVEPSSVAAGDFNGDGRADLAVTNEISASLFVFMATDDGFLDAIEYPTGQAPMHAATGDLNRDGRTDIVVATLESGALNVYLNSGVCAINCNTIAAPIAHPTSTAPAGVAAGDFNGDGRIDAAIANSGANSFSIALSNGDGTFTSATSIATGSTPRGVVAADFNRDGRVDLVSANGGSNNVSIALGNGNGSFQTAAHYAAGAGARALAAADFDRDGKLDLAVALHDADSVALLHGNGDGTFAAPVTHAAGTDPMSVATGDLDRDGDLDLAIANAGSNNISILRGNGDATFAAAVHFNTGTSPRGIAIVDLDRDGKLDVVTANYDSNNASLLKGNGNATFQAAVHMTAGTNPHAVMAADFNNDAIPDLAVANAGTTTVSIFEGTSTGSVSPAKHRTSGTSPMALAAADLNGDGKPDLVVANSGAATMAALLNTCPVPDLTVTKTHSGNFAQGDKNRTYTITVTNAGGAATTGTVTAAEVVPAGLVVTGMSGSGWTCSMSALACTRGDALAAGASYPAITVTVNVASGAAATVTNQASVSGGGELNALNNIASDPTTVTPITDIAIIGSHFGNFTQGSTNRSYTLLVRNAGGLATTGTVTVTDALPASLTAVSISGTGWNCTLGSLTCTRNDALAGNSAYPPITLVVNVAANAPAQVTNTASVSGGSDANNGNNTSSDPTIIWSSQTCASFGAPATYPSGGWDPYGLTSGDLNQDGNVDLIYTNYYEGKLSVMLGNSDGTFGARSTFLTGGYGYVRSIATADFNADGALDLVVGTGDYGTVLVLIGNGDGTFATPVSHNLAAAFFVTAGDFDNDGNVDVAALSGGFNGKVVLFPGTGSGALRAPVTLLSNLSYPQMLFASDLDRNGKLDLVAGLDFSGIRVLRGNGDLSFAAPLSYLGFADVYSMAAGDFNGDAKLDLAVANYYDGVEILNGNGDGTFVENDAVFTYYGASKVLVDDVNADSHADLLVQTYSGFGTSFGNGNGTFQPVAHYELYSASGLVAADFNHDGRIDLASAQYSPSLIAVMLGGCADLTVDKSHSGNFTTGKTGTYTITVKNTGSGASTGTMTVKDTLPAGLSAKEMWGSGWNCTLATLTCTTTQTLLAGHTSYPITLIVDVLPSAPTQVVNTATVSGGIDTNPNNNTDSDPTTIVLAPDVTLTKSHTGVFVAGASGVYTLTVRNAGGAATSGTITVTDTLPASMTATAMSGAGWTCNLASVSCSRWDALNPDTTYPPITLTVNIGANAPANVTNVAVVGGGVDQNTANNTAQDPTAILNAPGNVTALAQSTTSVHVSWWFVSAATEYEVFRSSNNGPFQSIAKTVGTGIFDNSVAANTAYVYRVRALNGTTASPMSRSDLAVTIFFTFDVYAGQPFRASHVTGLRTAVNAVRAAAGLPATTFADTIAVGSPMRASHVTALRTALDEARVVLGLPPVIYTRTLSPGVLVHANDILELRYGVQ